VVSIKRRLVNWLVRDVVIEKLKVKKLLIGNRTVGITGSYIDLPPTTAPTAVKGRMYFDSSANKVKVYDGTEWKEVPYIRKVYGFSTYSTSLGYKSAATNQVDASYYYKERYFDGCTLINTTVTLDTNGIICAVGALHVYLGLNQSGTFKIVIDGNVVNSVSAKGTINGFWMVGYAGRFAAGSHSVQISIPTGESTIINPQYVILKGDDEVVVTHSKLLRGNVGVAKSSYNYEFEVSGGSAIYSGNVTLYANGKIFVAVGGETVSTNIEYKLDGATVYTDTVDMGGISAFLSYCLMDASSGTHTVEVYTSSSVRDPQVFVTALEEY